MIEQVLNIETTQARRLTLHSLLYLPADYEARPSEQFPLILFLHGSGERGDNLEQVKKHGLPKKLESGWECPFCIVAPQCPADSIWVYQLEALSVLLDSVSSQYRVDPGRVYLTGLSLGGTGTWYMAGAFPKRFAAIAPICGHNTGRSHCELFKHIPAWIFHGAKDPLIPVDEARQMEAALQSLGAEVRLTIYPDAAHDSWTPAYDDPDLYRWFLRHTVMRSTEPPR